MSHLPRLSFDRMVYVRPGSTQSITLFTVFSLDEPVKTLGRTLSLNRAEAMCRGDQPLVIEPHSFACPHGQEMCGDSYGCYCQRCWDERTLAIAV